MWSNAGRLSCKFVSYVSQSCLTRSGLVESACPNLIKQGPKSVITSKRYFERFFCTFLFLLLPWKSILKKRKIKVKRIYKTLGIKIHGLRINQIKSPFADYCE